MLALGARRDEYSSRWTWPLYTTRGLVDPSAEKLTACEEQLPSHKPHVHAAAYLASRASLAHAVSRPRSLGDILQEQTESMNCRSPTFSNGELQDVYSSLLTLLVCRVQHSSVILVDSTSTTSVEYGASREYRDTIGVTASQALHQCFIHDHHKRPGLDKSTKLSSSGTAERSWSQQSIICSGTAYCQTSP